jgi:hypothetical protein
MNPPAATDSDPANYVAAVLILYVELPETPLRASVRISGKLDRSWSFPSRG